MTEAERLVGCTARDVKEFNNREQAKEDARAALHALWAIGYDHVFMEVVRDLLNEYKIVCGWESR